MPRIWSVALALLLLSGAEVAAKKVMGVTVYPGATYDADVTSLSKFGPKLKGAGYRTGDGIDKVVRFYRKQGLLFLKLGETSRERARFKDMKTGADVVVQNPWKNPRTGAVMHDTLILILHGEE